jgi:hypothetical protein
MIAFAVAVVAVPVVVLLFSVLDTVVSIPPVAPPQLVVSLVKTSRDPSFVVYKRLGLPINPR